MSPGLLLVYVLVAANIALTIWLYSRRSKSEISNEFLQNQFREERSANAESARLQREELARSQAQNSETMLKTLQSLGETQNKRLKDMQDGVGQLSDRNEQRIGKLTDKIESQLQDLRTSNEQKLEKMRETVDEKLQGTLEKRLGESFKLVSERLEAVQKGLGEMQELATGVGDLKAVLSNVKTRGTWGEIQLGALLEQILSPSQYVRNAKPKPDSDAVVEFAIKLPGKEDSEQSEVLLPIDAKFPQEDYNRLLDASEKGDSEEAKKSVVALLRAVEASAREIREKYIAPPHTTDFAILYLPTEGLYAEVVRSPDMLDRLQGRYRIVVAGPTTLAAILNSLQMGFRTLAIEKRSSEVWTVLSAVKVEFGKFGDVLDKVKRQIGTVSKSLEDTDVRRRAMDRKLRDVEQLPANQDAAGIIGFDDPDEESTPIEELTSNDET